MAVTPISPPVGELPSSITPVRFSVTNLVGLVIAVDHSDVLVTRPVELVFAEGVFLYPYLGSSSLDVPSKTFSILRQGGWASFEETNDIRVFEQTGGGQPWGVLYTVDLTAQPNQAISAKGSYTIDGKTWWVKGDPIFNQELGLINGSGLKCGNSNSGNSSLQLPSGTGTPGFSLYALPLDQLADFNPLAPVAIQYRMTANTLGGSSVRVYCGLVSAAKDNTAWSTRAAQLLYGISDTQHAGGMGGAGSWADVSTGVSTSDGKDLVCTLIRGAQKIGVGAMDPWTGAFPDIDAAGVEAPVGMVSGAPTVPCLLFGSSAPASQSVTAYLMSLRVLQPKAPS